MTSATETAASVLSATLLARVSGTDVGGVRGSEDADADVVVDMMKLKIAPANTPGRISENVMPERLTPVAPRLRDASSRDQSSQQKHSTPRIIRQRDRDVGDEERNQTRSQPDDRAGCGRP